MKFRGWGTSLEYRDSAIAVQAVATCAEDETAPQLAEAIISPSTGFATDYLNHFNEAIMLLDMVTSCPDCLTDFHDWQPLTYREHFLASRFKARNPAIAAYYAADPAVRTCLDSLTETTTTEIEATRSAMAAEPTPETYGILADRAAARLKLLVARAAAVINGGVDMDEPIAPQTVVGVLMRRSTQQDLMPLKC